MGAVVAVDPRTLTATPGLTASAQARVRNTGSVVDQFHLDVVGDASGWATVEPASLSLFPGAEGSVTVTFAPPRSPRVAAGSMPFGLRVQSKEDPAGSVVEEGTIEVGPFTDVSVELVPRTSRGSSGATHDVAVDNRGNVPLNASISATDPDRLLAFEVRPPAIVAGPGTASFAKLRVKPARRFWRGASVTRPFKLLADVPGAPPVAVDGALLQTPILPAWAIPAATAALALLVALAVLWLTVLQPAIQATARQQAQDVLAAAGISPLPSGAGSGGAGASASPAAGASGSPAATGSASPTPAASTGVTLADGQLLPGGSPLAPPSGTSFYLTDLVFSNPSSTVTGDIRLERSGQPLLDFRLENFRSLDFHFVTPIVIASGQQLRLVCPTGCPGAAVYYSGYQQ